MLFVILFQNLSPAPLPNWVQQWASSTDTRGKTVTLGHRYPKPPKLFLVSVHARKCLLFTLLSRVCFCSSRHALLPRSDVTKTVFVESRVCYPRRKYRSTQRETLQLLAKAIIHLKFSLAEEKMIDLFFFFFFFWKTKLNKTNCS